MQSKIQMHIESDILRMKIMKDLEGRHKIEIDNKQTEVERIS